MAKDYSEDLLIQQSTAELLEKELGWKAKRDIEKMCQDAARCSANMGRSGERANMTWC